MSRSEYRVVFTPPRVAVSERKIGIGFIGAGGIANTYADQLIHIPNTKLVAVASRTEEHAIEFAERFGIKRWYTDYLDLLKKDDVEAVIICTPPHLHAANSIAAAEAGKHIICDKPLATNLPDADKMILSAKKAGVKLMYGETERFNPIWRRCKELLDQGVLGNPILIRTYRCMSMYAYPPWKTWLRDPEKEGGGAIMESCHDLYVVRWLMGKVKRVYAESGTFACDQPAEDSCLLLLRFSNDAIGSVTHSWCKKSGYESKVDILGTEGNLSVNGANDYPISLVSTREVAHRAELPLGWTFPRYVFMEEFSHFIDCILQDKEPPVTGEDGKAILQIVAAAYESVKTGRTISIQ